MARRKRTIQNIIAQHDRAIKSLLEREDQKQDVAGVPSIGKYTTSQLRAYDKVNTRMSRPEFASRKMDKRFTQINVAAENQIKKLREQGRVARAARKAQGLSAG